MEEELRFKKVFLNFIDTMVEYGYMPLKKYINTKKELYYEILT